VTTAALIVAAGQGRRAGGTVPKQYARLGGETVLARTLTVFLEHPGVDLALVVVAEADRPLYDQTITASHPKLLAPAPGGATRQGSVLNGLRALSAHTPARVLIHDAARPFVTAATVDRVLAALERSPGAIAALPLADTLKRAGSDRHIAATFDRAGLWRAQTPQAFRFEAILGAHEAAAAAGRQDLTDDAAVAEWAGIPVALVEGSEANVKLTTADDLARAAVTAAAGSDPSPPASPFRLSVGGEGSDPTSPPSPDVRTGQGVDVHRFRDGDHVWLCGIRIAHSQGLEGHSDADAALHALTDALLGAIGDGDLGQHFADTDPRWKNAPSHLFLADAAARVRARGGTISNVDVTILCEAPRIAPHRDAMRRRIAEILGLDPGRVAVKATTTEGLGFTGRREGVAALATATVVLR